VFNVVNETITGGFGADVGTAPMETLSSEHTGELVPEFLVRAKEISNFTGTSTNIAS